MLKQHFVILTYMCLVASLTYADVNMDSNDFSTTIRMFKDALQKIQHDEKIETSEKYKLGTVLYKVFHAKLKLKEEERMGKQRKEMQRLLSQQKNDEERVEKEANIFKKLLQAKNLHTNAFFSDFHVLRY